MKQLPPGLIRMNSPLISLSTQNASIRFPSLVTFLFYHFSKAKLSAIFESSLVYTSLVITVSLLEGPLNLKSGALYIMGSKVDRSQYRVNKVLLLSQLRKDDRLMLRIYDTL